MPSLLEYTKIYAEEIYQGTFTVRPILDNKNHVVEEIQLDCGDKHYKIYPEYGNNLIIEKVK